MSRVNRSFVWNHFKKDVVIQSDGSTEAFAKCVHCDKGKYVLGPKANNSTGNMRYHLVRRHPDLVKFQSLSKTADIQSSSQLCPFASKNEGAHTNPRLKMVRFVVLSDQSFKIVEDESLRDMLNMLNPAMFTTELKISDATLKRDIIKEYEVELANVIGVVKQVHGQLSFTHDCWTSKNTIPFIAVTAHWIDEPWVQHDLLIGFMHFPGRHTGKNICETFMKLLCDRNIKTVLGVTMDNAANNDSFTAELENRSQEVGFRFNSSTRFRCFAHVLNIAVQDMLKVLKVEANHESQYDLSLREEDQSTSKSIGAAIAKIRKIASAVRMSHTKEEKLMELSAVYGISELKLILDVKTRWNSTYAMIKRAKLLRASLDSLTSMDKDLARFRVTDEEWLLIDSLEDILKDFDFATNRISRAKYPTASLVMPMYKLLMDKLEKATTIAIIPLREVCAKALEKLKAYFNYSDQTGLWVAMAMNPTLKLEWLKDHFDKTICKKVKAAVITVFTEYYEHEQTPRNFGNAPSDTSEETDILALYPKRGRKATKGAELLQYFRDDVAPPHVNILEWWKFHENDYKHVAIMARDYLGIPGSSVPAERIFSMGSDVVTPKRGSLKPETISAILCLKNWWKK